MQEHMIEQPMTKESNDSVKQTQAGQTQSPPEGKRIHNNNVLKERVVPALKAVTKRIIREEIVEDIVVVDEHVVEVVKHVVQEKIVEVPEIEYREKIKEVVETQVEEKVVEIPKVEYCERLIEVPKYITQERFVEVPQVEYRDVITERTINLPEVHQEFVEKEVEVPQYVDDQGNPVQRPIIEIERKIPIPVEAVTTYEYQLAQFRPRVTRVKYPMYVPRFVPVPVIAESIEAQKLADMQNLVGEVNKLVAPQAASLAEIDQLASTVKKCDYSANLPTEAETQQTIREKWLTGHLRVYSNDAQQVPVNVPTQ